MTTAEAIAQIREALDFTADEATSVLPLTRAETARQALTALDALVAEIDRLTEEERNTRAAFEIAVEQRDKARAEIERLTKAERLCHEDAGRAMRVQADEIERLRAVVEAARQATKRGSWMEVDEALAALDDKEANRSPDETAQP